MRVPFVDLARQYRHCEQSLQQAFKRVGESGHYILGPEVKAFEEEFADYCGCKYAVSVGNGSDALLLPLLAMNLGPEDEVITAPNSFCASAWVIVKAGAKLVFSDLDEDTMNLDTEKLEEAVTSKTRALLPVHLTGRIADMEAINTIAERHNLRVIEDAAQAVGARRNGYRAGTLGWCGGFSLHPLKSLHVYGDGGILTTDDPDLAEQVRLLRNHGLEQGVCKVWGINSRLDELQAAFLRVKLPMLDDWNARSREIAKRYIDGLRGKVTTPPLEAHEEPIFHRFMVRHEERDRLASFLAERGVETRINYPVPLHLHPAAREMGFEPGDFPVAEKLANTILSLPLYPELEDHEIDYVIEQVLAFPG